MASFVTRNSVRLLLFNEHDQLLLMCVEDASTTTLSGKSYGRFWFPIGGSIEAGETLEQAAVRETYEEAGLDAEEFLLGPAVWRGEHHLILCGKPTHLKETFVVATTRSTLVSLANLTSEEQRVVKALRWFSLQEIEHPQEVIFPVLLPKYLPEILRGEYPQPPIDIDLTIDP